MSSRQGGIYIVEAEKRGAPRRGRSFSFCERAFVCVCARVRVCVRVHVCVKRVLRWALGVVGGGGRSGRVGRSVGRVVRCVLRSAVGGRVRVGHASW